MDVHYTMEGKWEIDYPISYWIPEDLSYGCLGGDNEGDAFAEGMIKATASAQAVKVVKTAKI